MAAGAVEPAAGAAALELVVATEVVMQAATVMVMLVVTGPAPEKLDHFAVEELTESAVL